MEVESAEMSKQIVDKAAKLSQEIVALVHNDVLMGSLQIEEENKHEVHKKKQKIRSQTVDDKQLHEMIKKRKYLEDEISRIKIEQEAWRQRRGPLIKQNQEGKTKYFRSSLSVQQKSRIHNILLDTKKFEQETHLKNIKLYQQLKKMNEEQQKAKEIKMNQDNEQKRREINQKLKQLELRKIRRIQQMEQGNKEFQRVMKQKFFHQKVEQQWLALDQQLEEQNKRILEKMKQSKKYQPKVINEHASKYLEMSLRNKKKREDVLEKSRNESFQKSQLKRYGQSSFLAKINEEEEQKLRNSIKNAMNNEMLKVKRENYSQTVRQKNKNEIKAQKSSQIMSQRAQSNMSYSKSLDNLALNKLGNHSMREVRTSINQPSKTSKKKLPSINKVSEHQIKYTNYLGKAREEKKPQNPQQYAKQMVELKKVMSSNLDKDQQKLQKVKEIIHKMDDDSLKNDKKLINLIKAKIDVINHFKDNQ